MTDRTMCPVLITASPDLAALAQALIAPADVAEQNRAEVKRRIEAISARIRSSRAAAK